MRFPVWSFLLLQGCASSLASIEKDTSRATQDAVRRDSISFSTADDPGGDADFREATSHLFELDPVRAQKKLRAFVEHHKGRRQSVAANLLLARLQLAQGNAAGCLTLLEQTQVPDEYSDRLFVQGLCAGRAGQSAKAYELLLPFITSGPPPLAGIVDPDGSYYLHLTLAEVLISKGDQVGAIDQLGHYYQLSGIAEKEREYARQRAEELARSIPDGAAGLALSSPRTVLTRAVLGEKAMAAFRARGDDTSARQLEQSILTSRQQVGFQVSTQKKGPGDATRFGLAVPLSGALARLGDAILRGASLVLFRAEHGSETRPYQLIVRDSAAPAERSTYGGGVLGAVQSLIQDEGSVGIVTGHDPRTIDLASQDNVPLLLLDERAPGPNSTAFQMVHSSDARTTALAKRAWALGARRFAILGPDNSTGKKLAAAFRHTVESAGGSITGHILYPPQSTSFVTLIASLRKLPFDALFIPDDANRLELIAPALASADLWPSQPQAFSGSARDVGGLGKGHREALLLSTALSVSPKLVSNAERYIQGALLCPGFYPSEDNRSASFVTRFREIHEQAPSATDAYAYDAVSVLRAAVERGAKNRTDVVRLLATATFEGITGDIRFGADHTRADPPIVYVVNGTAITPLK
jgi:ABC-type branched-subunit amino acid transport system substrate-binding protein